jgi:TPR repeat protein
LGSDLPGCNRYLVASASHHRLGHSIRGLPAIDPQGVYNAQPLLDHLAHLTPFYFPLGTNFSGDVHVEVLHGKYKGWIASLDHIALSCGSLTELTDLLGIEDASGLTLDQLADQLSEGSDFFLFFASSFDALLSNLYVDPSGEEPLILRRLPDPRLAPASQAPLPTLDERRALAQHDAEAQFQLSGLFQRGEAGVPRDEAEACAWLLKAAQQGHARAQLGMGFLCRYDHSSVVGQDQVAARQWFEKASAQGNAEAQDALGHMLRKGLGGPRDDDRARHWLGLSAAQGHAPAMMNLGFLAPDEHDRLNWWIQAAELGDESAQECLWERHNALHCHAARCLERGAVRTWELLASQRDADAARRLALLHTEGGAIAPDRTLADHWATRAWTLDAESEARAANHAQAEQDLRTRADQGDADAQFAIGQPPSLGQFDAGPGAGYAPGRAGRRACRAVVRESRRPRPHARPAEAGAAP